MAVCVSVCVGEEEEEEANQDKEVPTMRMCNKSLSNYFNIEHRSGSYRLYLSSGQLLMLLSLLLLTAGHPVHSVAHRLPSSPVQKHQDPGGLHLPAVRQRLRRPHVHRLRLRRPAGLRGLRSVLLSQKAGGQRQVGDSYRCRPSVQPPANDDEGR